VVCPLAWSAPRLGHRAHRVHLDAAAAQAEVVARELPGLPVWAIDADGLVVRPGPRLVDGVEALAAILQPDPPGTAVPAGRIRRMA
jgi:iron complex transport system substrate-binding protein